MNIGDRVRLLQSSDEGRIVGFKDKNVVEIEIEDGFVVPALRSDIVMVSQEENKYFDRKTDTGVSREPASPAPKQTDGLTGIFLGFIPINENDISLYLFNFTEKEILYNVSESHGDNSKSLSHGHVSAENNSFVTYFKLSNFEKWPELWVQIIAINSRMEEKTLFTDSLVKLKAKSFFNSKRIIPKVEKEGYLIEVKNQNKFQVDPQTLKDNFFAKKGEPATARPSQEKKNLQLNVDLHLDKIVANPGKLDPDEIVDLQLRKFEKELDNALAIGAESIKFIHGIGNGVLRLKIHKILSQNKTIKFFEDADKGKFGYGATVVHL